jgi:hypothetical protein
MSAKLREKISAFSLEQLAELKSQALESIREYCADGGMSFPAEVIVSGTKSDPLSEDGAQLTCLLRQESTYEAAWPANPLGVCGQLRMKLGHRKLK